MTTSPPPDPGTPAPEESPHTESTAPSTSFGPASSFAPAQAFTPPTMRRQRASLLTSVLLGAAAAVAIGGVAFAAGRLTAPPSTVAGTGRFGGQNGQPFANASGRPGFGGSGGFLRGGLGGVGLRGTITSVSGNALTVKLTNGQEVKVQTDSTTTYHKQASASASDVTSGSQVIVELQAGTGGFGVGGQGGGATSTPTVKASDVTLAGQ